MTVSNSASVSSDAAAVRSDGSAPARGVSISLSRNGHKLYERTRYPIEGHLLIGPETQLSLDGERPLVKKQLLQVCGQTFGQLKLQPGMTGCLRRDEGAEIDLKEFEPFQTGMPGSRVDRPVPLENVADVSIAYGEYLLSLSFLDAEAPDLAFRRTDPAIGPVMQPGIPVSDLERFNSGAFQVTIEDAGNEHPPNYVFRIDQEVTVGTAQPLCVPLAADFTLVTRERGRRVLRLFESWPCAFKAPLDPKLLDLNDLRHQDRVSMQGGGVVSIAFPPGSSATVTIGNQTVRIEPLAQSRPRQDDRE